MSSQALIYRYLEEQTEGVTLKQIAAFTDLHIQTVRAHIDSALEKGTIEQVGKKGKAHTYKIALANVHKSARIIWKGHAVPMSELIMTWASDKNTRPKNSFDVVLGKEIIRLFNLALKAIDEDNPQKVSFLVLKESRANIIMLLDQMKQIFATAETLVNNNDLWNPSELPAALLLKEDSYTPLQLKRAIEELTGGNN